MRESTEDFACSDACYHLVEACPSDTQKVVQIMRERFWLLISFLARCPLTQLVFFSLAEPRECALLLDWQKSRQRGLETLIYYDYCFRRRLPRSCWFGPIAASFSPMQHHHLEGRDALGLITFVKDVC